MKKGCILMNKYCYMTLVTNEKFLPCVIRCNQTMEHFKSKYPYIVLIPNIYNQKIKDILIENNILYKEINVDKFVDGSPHYYNDTINKFQLLNFIEYEKICFLDADVFLNSNIDNEFDKFTSEDDIFYLYSEHGNDKENSLVLTGQSFIIRPNPEFYQKILDLTRNDPERDFDNDEEILNYYFNEQRGLRKMPDGISHFGGFIKPWEPVVPRFHSIKNIFTKASKEEFLSIFNNYIAFLGLYHQWTDYQNVQRAFAYTVIVKTVEDAEKVLKLNQQMRDYGFSYPIISCIASEDKEIQNILDSKTLPFRLIPPDQDYSNLFNCIQIQNKLFEFDYYGILFINNLDIQILESFDFIFSIYLKTELKKQFFEKYNNELILLTYS